MVEQSLSLVIILVISDVVISSNLVVLKSDLRNENSNKGHLQIASVTGEDLTKFESSKLVRKRNTFDEYGNFDPQLSTKEPKVWFHFTSASPYLQKSTEQVEVETLESEQQNMTNFTYQTSKKSISLLEASSNSSFSLNHIGCFSTWEKQYTFLQSPDESQKYDDSQLAIACVNKCLIHGLRYQISFVKGAECKCSPVQGFESELTDDSLCNIKCPVKDFDPSVNGEIKNPCGGNRGYSVYCTSGQESCTDLVRDVERQRKAQENSKSIPLPSPDIRNSVAAILQQPCIKCNYSQNHFCKSPHILPSNDYFPTNSPETCVEYCGSSVSYLMRGSGDKERLPTKYALLTWWYDNQADWPICSCIDEEQRQLLSDEDPTTCNVPCPGNPSAICGGKEQGTVIFGTVYCVDNLNCTPFEMTTTTTSKSHSWPTIDPCSDDDEIECEEGTPPESGTTEPPLDSSSFEPPQESDTTEEPTTPTDEPTTTEPTETTWETETATAEVTNSTTPSTTTSTPSIPTPSTPTPSTPTPSTPTSSTPTPSTSTPSTLTSTTTPSVSTSTPTTISEPKPTTPTVCSNKCQSHDRRGYYWEACAGRTAIARCADLHQNSTGSAFWNCLENGEFETSHPDVSNCTSVWLEEKQEQIKNITDIDGADSFVSRLSEACKNSGNSDSSSKYYGHEIRNIVSLVGSVVSKAKNFSSEGSLFSELESVVGKAVDLNAFLMQYHEPWKDLPLPEKSEISTDIIDNTEDAIFHLTHESYDEHYKRIFNSANSTDANKFLIMAETFDKETYTANNGRYEFPPKAERDEHDSFIKLPDGWSKQVKNKQIEIAAMSIGSNTISSIMPGQYESLVSSSFIDEGGDEKSKLINGNLISFTLMTEVKSQQTLQETSPSLNRPSIHFNGKGVEITFHHDLEAWGDDIRSLRRHLHDGEKPKAVLGSSQCVYWNTTANLWSSKGCKTVKANRYETVCECDHLTSFAILMDVHRYVGKEFGLELLTLILCPASEIALLVSIIILSSVGGLQKMRATITKNLSICLFVGNALVLFVLDRHYFDMNEATCVGAAMLTHYVFLSAFMWMLIEGVQLYRMVVHVFDSGRSYIRYFGIFAYGSPIIIIAITAAVGYLRGDKPYGGDVYCWLEGSYMWSFLGPVAVITTINFVVLFIALKTAYHVQQNKKASPVFIMGKIRSYKTWFKGCFSLTVILGLTWVVGFFTLMKAPGGIVAAYFFTILNASQGMFIFFFNCVFNEKVRSFTRRNLSTYLPSWLSSSSVSSNGGNQGNDGSAYGKRPLSSMKSGEPYMTENGKKNHSTKRNINYARELTGLPYVTPIKIDKEVEPVRRGQRNTRVDFVEPLQDHYISDIPMQRCESMGTISSVDSTRNSSLSETGPISLENSQHILISNVRFR